MRNLCASVSQWLEWSRVYGAQGWPKMFAKKGAAPERLGTKWSVGDKRKDMAELMCDMYASPLAVRLRSVPSGKAGFAQDSLRIRGYFSKAEREVSGSKG